MQKLVKEWSQLGVSSRPFARILRFAVFAWLLFFAFQFITLDFNWQQQVALGALTIVIAYAFHSVSGSEAVTMVLMLASMLATARYAYWRCLSVYRALMVFNNHLGVIDVLCILTLLLAEIYAWIALYLGYVQSIRPLRRTPTPLPFDVEQWPHVDVLIPTYNEPLSVVRATAFAAQNIDYPPEKLHVYILDDGRRSHFEQFCIEMGIGYMTRPDNQHAKAGNINRALQSLHSPYVAIFDCDHVPTRSFLQLTLGWLLKDPRLSMVQTPHFYYSPDPFERNLDHFKEIPNEGELFYGVLQDGNDLWNATFFCGSCAVLRRSALDQIGGIATETVTEDAHTSLRMQMLGWDTAYINIPQAAGLATETLSSHIGQRIRWARGMTQILRTDCPLFVKGLKWPQRLCYFNSMIHYLYAAPRLVFLLAPLVYMLFGRTCIPGFWGAVLAYALPHLFLSNLTNFRIQGRHRFSFWNEVYETILAPYILAPTLLALVNPRLGKFKVTAKGGIVRESFFDFDIALPYVVLILLNLLALAVAPFRILYQPTVAPSTVIISVLWILFNTVLLGTAAGVAMENRQLRKDVRLDMSLPLEIHLPGQQPVFGESVDMSLGGASLRLDHPLDLTPGMELEVFYPLRDHQVGFKATLLSQDAQTLRIQYHKLTLQQEELLTLVLFSGADTWLNRMEGRPCDRPMRSFGQIVRLSIRGLGFAIKSLARQRKPRRATDPATVTATILLLSLALCLPLRMSAEAIPPGPASSGSPADSGTFDHQLSFQNLVPDGELEFDAPQSAQRVPLNLPSGEVVQRGQLHLRYTFATSLIARRSLLKVLLNGTLVAVLPAPEGPAAGQPISTDLSLPGDLFLHNNTLEFKLAGEDPAPCEHPRNQPWARIDARSTVETAGVLLPLANNLTQLPLPFYEGDVSGPVAAIPFAFLTAPDRQTLQAAGVVASWFGVRAGSQSPDLPVSIGRPLPQGNVILFADRPASLPPGLNLTLSGPVIAERTNPDDPYGKVLIVAGADGAEILAAAQALALQQNISQAGDVWTPPAVLPPKPSADDAPLWLRIGRTVPLWASASEQEKQANGTGPIFVDLHLPPDLYYGGRTFLTLRADYTYSPAQTAPGSLLRIAINGVTVEDLPLPPGTQTSRRVSSLVYLPIADLRPFANRLEFRFLPPPTQSSNCVLTPPIDLHGAISSSSSLSLRQLHHWAILPNLKLFSAAGFPFTRYADLSQSTIFLPQFPSTGEIALYLMLLEFFGSQTGSPALRVHVGEPGIEDSSSDALVIGTAKDQPAFAQLHAQLPTARSARDASPAAPASLLSTAQRLGWQVAEMNPHAWRTLKSLVHKCQGRHPLPAGSSLPPAAVIQELPSPWAKGRTVVTVALRDDKDAAALRNAFRQTSIRSGLADSVSVLSDGIFFSYCEEDQTYAVGRLQWWEILRYHLREFPWLIVLLNFLLALLLAPWIQARLDSRQRIRLETGRG
ncbi:MAG: UDP-forming cellulose synthase catalytic subunit [Acidobacteriaceae bacterium]